MLTLSKILLILVFSSKSSYERDWYASLEITVGHRLRMRVFWAWFFSQTGWKSCSKYTHPQVRRLFQGLVMNFGEEPLIFHFELLHKLEELSFHIEWRKWLKYCSHYRYTPQFSAMSDRYISRLPSSHFMARNQTCICNIETVVWRKVYLNERFKFDRYFNCYVQILKACWFTQLRNINYNIQGYLSPN